jgi:hypothetical protein
VALNLNLQQGTSFDWQLQALNPDDSVPVGQFLSSDTLSANLWSGASDVSLITFSTPPTWIDATNAQYQISFNNSDMALLALGVYFIQATATRSGRSATLLPYGSTVTLQAAPGAALLRPTYITSYDLRRIAPWIDQVSAPNNQTGFLDQCADSRDWLDENIIRNYRGGNVELLGYHGLALDAWYTGGARRTSLRNPWIVDLLKTNSLIVTTRTKDVCAYYALSRICESLIQAGAVTHYLGLSARYRHECQRLLTTYTAELNLNGATDAYGKLLASVPINFSSSNTLWA